VKRGLLLFLVVAAASGCGGGKSHTSALTATSPTPEATTGVSTSQATPKHVKYRYPRVLQRAFLLNCVKSGGTTKICACTLHRLQQTMPVAQFTSVGLAIQRHRKPPAALERRITRIAVKCATNPA
jgi:hypothetical protein